MIGRLLRVTGTVLAIAVAFVTPVLATSTSASADTVVGGCTIVSNPTPTNFTNCPGLQLDSGDFTGLNLSYADFQGAQFIGVPFTNANLSSANLSGAGLGLASATGADMSNANLSSAILVGEDLSNANLSSANLTGATFAECISGLNVCLNDTLTGAQFDQANLTNATFAACISGGGCTASDLSGAVLTGATLTGASLSACLAGGTCAGTLIPSDQTVPVASGVTSATVSWPTPAMPPGTTAGSCTPASGSTFPGGTTIVTCQVLDDHGDVATGSFTVTVLVPTPTSTSLSSSANPAVVGQPAPSYTATVSPTPSGGTVSFTDNGSPIVGCSAAPLTTGSVTCPSVASAAGTHDIVATYSGFDNFEGSTSPTLTEVVNNPPPPATSVVLPSSGSTVSNGVWLDAVASASSPFGVASVSYEVSGGPNSVTDMVVSSSQRWIYGYLGAWNTADVPNGTYTLQSVATDSLGQSTTSAPITVIVDNLPLQTTVLVPSNGATLSGTSAVLDASATGTAPVTSVQFEVTGGSLSNQVGTATPSLYGWFVKWNTTGVPNGTYTLQSVATEVGGTTATSPGITVTVQN